MLSRDATPPSGTGATPAEVPLDGIARSVGAGAALHAAWRLGVLSRLADEPADPATVAGETGLDPRLTAAVLKVLAALGIAGVDQDGRYGVAAATPSAVAWAQRIYARLPEVWQDPLAGPRYDEPGGAAAAYPDLVGLLPSHANGIAAEVAGHFARPGLRVLDVGAGAAPWSLAVAGREPTCRVTALDLPEVIEVTRRVVAAAGCEQQYDFAAGDMFAWLPPGPYDLVLAGAVCHLFDGATAAGLIARLAHVVAPGGRLAIIDGIADDADADPAGQAIYELGLAVRTRGGRLHASAAQRGWLEAAGLADVASQAVAGQPGLRLIVGRRPLS